MKEYHPTPEAVAQAKELGVYGDVVARLKRMARQAAPYTSEYANRRFHDLSFSIVGDKITGVFPLTS